MSRLYQTLKKGVNKACVQKKASRSLLFEVLESRELLYATNGEILGDVSDSALVASPIVANDVLADASAETSSNLAAAVVAEDDAQEVRSLKVLIIGNSLSEDARTLLADAVAQYPWLDSANVKLGSLYQGGRSLGYFANCARVEQGEAPTEYDYDSANNSNDNTKSQLAAPNNGYLDATQNFCEYYEWNGLTWSLVKGVKNVGEKTIAYAMEQTDWDVVLIQGFYYDFADGTELNGYDGTSVSADPFKADDPYNLKDSLCSNLEYLCDYLRALDNDVKIGFYMPTVHHETQSIWLDNDPYASIVRTTEYVLENTDCVDFIVPACTYQENAKTTYLGSLNYADPTGKDVVTTGLRRDTIHSSNYLGRELLAIGIVDCVLNYLYGDDIDVQNDRQSIEKVEAPSYDSLPVDYADILHAAVAAANANPLEIADLSAFGTEDPATTAFNAAQKQAEETDDPQACVEAALAALSDKQRTDLVVNYETTDGLVSLSFTYGYTTSDVLTFELKPREDDAEAETEPSVFRVDSLEDVVDDSNGVLTLREAVMQSTDGGLIVFSEALAGETISLGGTQIVVDKTITIDASMLQKDSEDEPGLTIDAGGVSRIFNVVSGATSLKGLRLVNGFSEESGGAINAELFTSLTIENSVFSGNAATVYGGAIRVGSSSSLTIVNSDLNGNSAGQIGGAVYASSTTITIQNSQFSQNAATYGGAIGATSSSTLTIEDAELYDNAASRSGGAIYATGTNAERALSRVRIYGNAAENGAGIYALGDSSSLTLQNACVYENKSVQEGSAIEVKFGELNLYSTTIVNNASSGKYAAVYTTYVDASFYNSIIAYNTGSNFTKKSGTANAYHVLSNVRNWTNEDAVYYVYNTKSTVFTNVNGGDYTLASKSLARDAGDSVFVGDSTDLAGNWRITGDSVDLGAFEYLEAENKSTLVNSLDDTIDPYDGVVTLREAVEIYAKDADTIVFDPSLLGGRLAISKTDVPITSSLSLSASELAGNVDYSACFEPTIDWKYDPTSRVATLEWEPIDGAASYLVKISRDGGATWLNYAKDVVGTTRNVNGVYSGKSYAFKVFAYNADGTRLSETRNVSFVAEKLTDDALFFDYDAQSREATLTWGAIPGAASYVVETSVDDGERWIVLDELTEESFVVENLRAGYSYDFRVIALDAQGAPLSTELESTFAPIATDVSVVSGMSGTTIDVAFTKAEAATADVRWFYVTENGDVEIEEAANLLQYSPESDEYDVRVVVTGTGVSQGVNSTTTVLRTLKTIYDPEAATPTFSWEPIAGVESYRVMTRREDAATWTVSVKSLTETTTSISGLAAGHSYSVMVYGIDANGKTYIQGTTIAPISISASAVCYAASNRVTVSLKGAENAAYNLQWFYVAEDGDVEIEEAANETVFFLNNSQRSVKVVATGTGDSEGVVVETSVAFDVMFDYDLAQKETTITWDPIPGAVAYRVNYKTNGKTSWTCYAEGFTEPSLTVADQQVGSFYQFRIYGIAEDGSYLGLDRLEATFAPAVIVSDRPTFDYNYSTRQALVTWAEQANATSYQVKLSKDGGETWSTLAQNLQSPSLLVKSLYVGKSYVFQLCGYNSDGKIVSVQTSSFDPIGLTAYSSAGSIYVKLNGTEDVTANVRWYYVTEEGDVDIPEAATLRKYAPTSYDYPIKIVASGNRNARGSQVSLTIAGKIEFDYDLKTQRAKLTWDALPDAQSYLVKISKDGGTTWITYAKDLTSLETTVRGLVPGNAYQFQVFGVTATGTDLNVVETGTLSPIEMTTSVTQHVSERTIEVSVLGSVGTAYKLRWYYVTEEGDVEIEEAESQRKVVLPNDGRVVKAVVTGGNNSLGSNDEETIESADIDFTYRSSTQAATISWSPVEGAQKYLVDVSRDGETTWERLATTTATSKLDVPQIQMGRYCDVRILAFNSSKLLQTLKASFTPVPVQNASISFDGYDTASRSVTLSWTEFSDADRYLVKISRDGGETWLTYAKDLEETSKSINGLYVGKSYDFRVYALKGNTIVAVSQVATFAPQETDPSDELLEEAFADLLGDASFVEL